MLMFTVPMAAAALAIWLFAPANLQMAIWLLGIPIIGTTWLVNRNMTKAVMVFLPDGPLVAADEYRIWREDFNKIPDTARRNFLGKRVPWIYPVFIKQEAGETPAGTTALLPDIVITDVDGAAWAHRREYGYRAFSAWDEPLSAGEDIASASSVAEIRSSMEEAERIQRHQDADGREVVRYGLLAALTGGGLMMAYFAMTKAVDAFAN